MTSLLPPNSNTALLNELMTVSIRDIPIPTNQCFNIDETETFNLLWFKK